MVNLASLELIVVYVIICLALNVKSLQINRVSSTPLREKYVSGNNTDQVMAVKFLRQHDRMASEQCYASVVSEWKYATNITQWNRDRLLNEILTDMENNYSTAKICPYDQQSVEYLDEEPVDKLQCNLALEPELTRILAKSRDYDELLHVWKSWRDKTGRPIRSKYIRFVELSNEAARLNGFNDMGEMWRESYDSSTFISDLEKLWDDLRPLYEHLHAFVRMRLRKVYGDKIRPDGPIPAHLLGNMWAQNWRSLQDLLLPFPDKPSVDVTANMIKKNVTRQKMFEISEEFFTSLGLKPMPKEFWEHSIIEKPKDREIVCHASAWDFCNGKDFRIKMCTDITMKDLIVVHHEMGHIQYFLQYAHQPMVFREGANPGFHEALGDVLALSVSTPSHLKKIGLLDEVSDDIEGDINYLMSMALDKIAFLPAGYLMDLWRWKVFSGDIKPNELNRKWWEHKLNYQGVCPPVLRTENDFDPSAKFHINSNTPYIRYFVSFVVQFQFHKALCDASGYKGDLYKCDISHQSAESAGQLLSQVLELGSSEPWQEAMKIMTGGETDRMDAKPILEYFEPLLVWLKQQTKSEFIGWKSNDPMICPGADDF